MTRTEFDLAVARLHLAAAGLPGATVRVADHARNRKYGLEPYRRAVLSVETTRDNVAELAARFADLACETGGMFSLYGIVQPYSVEVAVSMAIEDEGEVAA